MVVVVNNNTLLYTE